MRWEDETGWPKSVPPLTMERVFHARTWNSEKRKKEWDSGSLHTNLPRCNGSVEPFNRLGKRPKKRRYITRPRLFNTAHEVLSANGRSLQSGLFDRVRGFIFILLYPLFFFYLFYLFFLFVFFFAWQKSEGRRRSTGATEQLYSSQRTELSINPIGKLLRGRPTA